MKASGMRVGGLVAGIILVVLAEGIITSMGNPTFLDNTNRSFELVVGIFVIIVAASTMDRSRG